MAVPETKVSGREALALPTALLQRARIADPLTGLWEAADVQWWSRRPRPSDDLEQLFWSDEHGPVAAVYLTSWGEDRWQCDVLAVPGLAESRTDEVWAGALEQVGAHTSGTVEVPVQGSNVRLRALAVAAGLVPGEQSSTAWMDATSRPELHGPAEGYVLTDRTRRSGHRIP